MLLRPLRWVSGLDRSYFFALTAFIAALIASIFLAFAPTIKRFDGSTATLIEENGAGVIVLLVLPVLVLGSPLIALPQKPGPRSRNDKINAIAATGVTLAFVVAFLDWISIFYLPALIMSTASTVSLYFGRNRKAVPGMSAARGRERDGVRLSRSARKSTSAAETEGAGGQDGDETRAAGSRRRRGRRRKR